MIDNFQLSQILALQAEVFAINAEIEGMKADNSQFPEDQPFGQEHFEKKAEELYGIANAIVVAGRS